MASRAIEAGRAFIELFLKDNTRRQFAAFERRTAQIGRGIASVGARLTAIGLAGGAALIPAVKAASDLEEQVSKFNVVFGQQSEAVRQFAQRFASDIGRSERQIVEFLASFQDLFVPIGFDPIQAESLSKQLTQLTLDVASFNNKADEDVLRDFQSALTGSGETVKKYGIILNEAGVKAELFNQGLDPRNATNQEKVLARLNILLRGSTSAQGDAARTADSFANQSKRLRGELENMAAAIGNALIPELARLAGLLSVNIQRISEWIAINPGLVQTLAKVTAGVTALGVGLLAIGPAVTAIGRLAAILRGVSIAAAVVASAPISVPFALATAAAVALAAVIAKLSFDRFTGGLKEVESQAKKAKDAVADLAAVRAQVAQENFETLRNLPLEPQTDIETQRGIIERVGAQSRAVFEQRKAFIDAFATLAEEQGSLSGREQELLSAFRSGTALEGEVNELLDAARQFQRQRIQQSIEGFRGREDELIAKAQAGIATRDELKELATAAREFQQQFDPFARLRERQAQLERFGGFLSDFARQRVFEDIQKEFDQAIGGEQLQKLEEARQKLKSLQEQEPETQRSQGTFFGSIAGRVFGTSRDPLEEQVKQQKLTVAELEKISTATTQLAQRATPLVFGAG
jgi:ubiquitin